MYYVYILRSKRDREFYTGFTDNLEKRVLKHNSGSVTVTKPRRPFELVYFEGGLNKKDALHREIYLKTAWGKRYIKSRLKNYLNGKTPQLNSLKSTRIRSQLDSAKRI